MCSILKETYFFLHQMFVTEGKTSFSIICISDFSINELYLIQVQTSNSSSHFFFSVVERQLRFLNSSWTAILRQDMEVNASLSVHSLVASQPCLSQKECPVREQTRLDSQLVIKSGWKINRYIYVCKHLYSVTWTHRYKLFRRQRKMFFFSSQAWNKEKILSPHEKSNLTTSASMLQCSAPELQRLYGEQGPLKSS